MEKLRKRSPISTVHAEAWRRVTSGSILNHSINVNYKLHPHQKNVYQNLSKNSEPSNNNLRSLNLISESGMSVENTSPIRILFETSSFERLEKSVENEAKLQAVQTQILPELSRVWGNALRVVPITKPILIPQGACYGIPIFPDRYKTEGVSDTDLIVFVDVEDCEGRGALAYAFPCSMDQYDRPIIGFVSFCLERLVLDQDLQFPDSVKKSVTQVAIHEIAHILGMSASLFPYFRNPVTGEPLTPRPLEESFTTCVDGAVRLVLLPSKSILREKRMKSNIYFEVVTPTVVQVVKNQFNCSSMTGAMLENQITNLRTCFGSHWDERYFYTEALGPMYSPLSNILSPLTISLLEDSGWYVGNYMAVSISPFGHAAGCDFTEKDCIVNGAVPSYSKGFFCNDVSKLRLDFDEKLNLEGSSTCDPTHNYKAFCDLFYGNFTPAPTDYYYFLEPNLSTSLQEADYCPIPRLKAESCNTYSSSRKEGEIFGPTSKCFNMENGEPSSICLPSQCNGKMHTLEVIMNEKIITCEYDGQRHPLSGNGFFFCPRLASICPDMICPANCSGKGECDYLRQDPECVCFDPADKSPGCYGSLWTEMPTSSPTQNYEFHEPTSSPSPRNPIDNSIGGPNTNTSGSFIFSHMLFWMLVLTDAISFL